MYGWGRCGVSESRSASHGSESQPRYGGFVPAHSIFDTLSSHSFHDRSGCWNQPCICAGNWLRCNSNVVRRSLLPAAEWSLEKQFLMKIVRIFYT